MTDRDISGGTTPTETPTSNASTDAPGAASPSTGYIAELSQLKRDLAEEFERLRTAKLDDFESFSSNVAFHLGYMDSAILQLVNLLISKEVDRQG